MKLCVIPARGGSKRIPRKNIRPFCGKPIITYSIEAALNSGCFDKVIVSTDDPEIAALSKQAGAEIPFMRPQNLADDHTSSGAVTSHAVNWFQDQGIYYDYVCTLYATAPFLTGSILSESLDMLLDQPDFVYCFGGTEFGAPIQRALRRLNDGRAVMFHPENYYVRSQDLERAYHDVGQFYWGKSDAWIEDRPVFLEKALMYVLPRTHVEDIDTLEDWTRAENLYRILNEMAPEEDRA